MKQWGENFAGQVSKPEDKAVIRERAGMLADALHPVEQAFQGGKVGKTKNPSGIEYDPKTGSLQVEPEKVMNNLRDFKTPADAKTWLDQQVQHELDLQKGVTGARSSGEHPDAANLREGIESNRKRYQQLGDTPEGQAAKSQAEKMEQKLGELVTPKGRAQAVYKQILAAQEAQKGALAAAQDAEDDSSRSAAAHHELVHLYNNKRDQWQQEMRATLPQDVRAELNEADASAQKQIAAAGQQKDLAHSLVEIAGRQMGLPGTNPAPQPEDAAKLTAAQAALRDMPAEEREKQFLPSLYALARSAGMPGTTVVAMRDRLLKGLSPDATLNFSDPAASFEKAATTYPLTEDGMDQIIALGRQRGLSPVAIASALQNARQRARNALQADNSSDLDKLWSQWKALDKSMGPRLKELQLAQLHQTVFKSLADSFEDPAQIADFYKALQDNPDLNALTKAHPEWKKPVQDLQNSLDATAGHRAFEPVGDGSAMRELKFENGLIGNYFAQPNGDGTAAAMLKIPSKDSEGKDIVHTAVLRSVPMPTDTDVRQAIDKADKRIASLQQSVQGLSKAISNQGRPFFSMGGPTFMATGGISLARTKLQKDLNEVQTRQALLSDPRIAKRYLFEERVSEALSNSSASQYVGSGLGLGSLANDFARGLVKANENAHVLFHDLTGNTDERDRYVRQLQELNAIMPGANGARYRGGVAGTVSRLSEGLGQNAPAVAAMALNPGASMAMRGFLGAAGAVQGAAASDANALEIAQSYLDKAAEVEKQNPELAQQLRQQYADTMARRGIYAGSNAALQAGNNALLPGFAGEGPALHILRDAIGGAVTDAFDSQFLRPTLTGQTGDWHEIIDSALQNALMAGLSRLSPGRWRGMSEPGTSGAAFERSSDNISEETPKESALETPTNINETKRHEQTSTQEPGGPRRGAETGALESAADFLRRGEISGELPSSAEKNGPASRGTEFRRILEWAHKTGRVLTEEEAIGDRQPLDAGMEHRIFYRVGDDRVIKLTHPGLQILGSVFPPRLPSEYLQSHVTTNRVFGDDVKLVGIVPRDDGPVIVTSQRYVKPHEVRHHPDWPEISKFMRDRKFEYSDGAWMRRDGVLVEDTHSGNFIRTPEGNIVPIDVKATQHDPARWKFPTGTPFLTPPKDTR